MPMKQDVTSYNLMLMQYSGHQNSIIAICIFVVVEKVIIRCVHVTYCTQWVSINPPQTLEVWGQGKRDAQWARAIRAEKVSHVVMINQLKQRRPKSHFRWHDNTNHFSCYANTSGLHRLNHVVYVVYLQFSVLSCKHIPELELLQACLRLLACIIAGLLCEQDLGLFEIR